MGDRGRGPGNNVKPPNWSKAVSLKGDLKVRSDSGKGGKAKTPQTSGNPMETISSEDSKIAISSDEEIMFDMKA
ncbi:hypothetical protein Syun_011489 [Stephania yunnanensis]|uniref:Uncharacterized protein n=1 Tax=Stephania yunnanensis TaxID=152371 RepID=A0AAP0PGI7_9MAGN